MNTSQENSSRFCHCGHLTRHHVFEVPPSTFDPDLPDPEAVFKRCEGKSRTGKKPESCACKKHEPFPMGTYKHLKTGNLYIVYGLEFDSETKQPRVQYAFIPEDPAKSRKPVEHGEKWTRPIHGVNSEGKPCGFMDPDGGRPRFELLTPLYAVDLVNNVVHIQPPFEIDLKPRDMIELQDVETPEWANVRASLQELTERVATIEKERDDWKRRAAAHGCNTKKGDPDCG